MAARRHHAMLGAWLWILVSLAGVACNDEAPDRTCACAEAEPPVDSTLMAFLSKARAAHHQADQREEADDLAGAVVALEKISGTQLGPMAERPESREVLADTRARLADLRSQLGHHDAAEADVVTGLQLAPKDSYFEGHLYEVRGVVDERRSKSLVEKGDAAGAEQARRRAFESFEKAIEIQDRVIRKELADAGGAPR